MTYQDYLEKVHCDPRHPGSFGGVDNLYEKRKIRAGKSQDKIMVRDPRDVRFSQTDQAKI